MPAMHRVLYYGGISFAILKFKYLIVIINVVQGPRPLAHYRKARCK